MKALSRIFPLTVACLCVSACVNDPFRAPAAEARILELNQSAADALAARLKGRVVELRNGRAVALGETILVTTFVDVNDVKRSSGFGRICAEQIAGRLAEKGFVIPELKMAEAIRVSDGAAPSNQGGWTAGEFALSRDIQDLAQSKNASIVVAGTYAVGDTEVLVTARAVDAKTGQIVAAKSYAAPRAQQLFLTRR